MQDLVHCLQPLDQETAWNILSQLYPPDIRICDNFPLDFDLVMAQFLQWNAQGALLEEISVRCMNGIQLALAKGCVSIPSHKDVVPLCSLKCRCKRQLDPSGYFSYAYIATDLTPRKPDLGFALQQILVVAILENGQRCNEQHVLSRLSSMLFSWLPHLFKSAEYIPITKSNLAQHRDIQQQSLFLMDQLKELTNSTITVICATSTSGDIVDSEVDMAKFGPLPINKLMMHLQTSFLSIVSPPSVGASQLKHLEAWEKRLYKYLGAHTASTISPTPLTDAFVRLLKDTLVLSRMNSTEYDEVVQCSNRLEKLLNDEGTYVPPTE
ncbi:hypothetical protein AMATHDRAFT_51290 [Amanita thiersii Skay4041]|uniref:Uncharacterized protein n=1 Tax=Amanita thiersii Skay4041 TaxID=703135 RepID=A0A2A9NE90_9AGAR|nr:hypothetical protein AMATHDRAFT_51290 [Amanita thiersii Skay4041]